jgi:hypothetical protein
MRRSKYRLHTAIRMFIPVYTYDPTSMTPYLKKLFRFISISIKKQNKPIDFFGSKVLNIDRFIIISQFECCTNSFK